MKFKLKTIAIIMGLIFGSNVMAQTELEKLRSEVDSLNKKAKEWEAFQAPKDQLQTDVEKLNVKAKEWEEWKTPKTLIHLAGYADVNYIDVEDQPGTFSLGSFSPIFHFQFADSFMLEAELEFEIDEAGASEAGVDYLTIDWFMSDYAMLIAGKFLSPLGQFRQNIHPSWINKMASAPVGFGHDQAAPSAEVGLMVRGSYLTDSSISLNYSVYIGNGPTLEGNEIGDEIEMIETPGLNQDADGKKVAGGRLGIFFPRQKLEFGISAAGGKVSLRTDDGSGGYSYDEARDYNALGADFNWRISNIEFRGEFIQQEIGEQLASTASEGGKWSAGYLQSSYRFLPSNWEAVLRYGQYDTPHPSEDLNQTTAGVNYLFASNLVAKLNYEANENPNAGNEASDRILVQLAYGF
ncbi:MAG: hypothetical protein BMS9Abin36_1161 [Gammaproteobacteria bacterium]|nr:MAG: hypothetical protein BMS9Abin36_1161 [Gammaproteobacteria bacterium]